MIMQQPAWISEALLGGLLNVSLQVAQLQELVPSDTSAVAQVSSSPKASDKPLGLGFGDDSASSEDLPHLVLQLLGASSADVQLQALMVLERLSVEPANAQCLAALGIVPRLTQLLAGSGAAEQGAAAGILKHLASGRCCYKTARIDQQMLVGGHFIVYLYFAPAAAGISKHLASGETRYDSTARKIKRRFGQCTVHHLVGAAEQGAAAGTLKHLASSGLIQDSMHTLAGACASEHFTGTQCEHLCIAPATAPVVDSSAMISTSRNSTKQGVVFLLSVPEPLEHEQHASRLAAILTGQLVWC
jgi:hypothetical protein